MPIHPFPTLPMGCFQINARFESARLFPNIQTSPVARLIWSFIAVDPFPPGWLPAPSIASYMLPWLQSVTSGITPSGLGYPIAYGFVRCPAGDFKGTTSWVPTLPFKGDFVSFPLAMAFTKRGVSGGRNHVGRAHFFPVPKSFLNADGNYSTSALTQLHATCTALNTGMLVNGVHFKPIVISAQLGSYDLLDHVDLVEGPRYLYRRRVNRDHFCEAWSF